VIDNREAAISLTRWVGFLSMCVGMFMAVLDIQIVASSLPDIQAGLAIPFDRLSWVQTAYLIAEVVAIPLTSRLTRLMSLGGLFSAATGGFVAASLGCGLSTGFAALVLFRVIQGFCGGMLIPAVFTAVFVLFPERARVLPTTIAGVFAVLAPTLGPTIGGYITENYSWHWLFFINLVPGIAVGALVARCVRAGAPDWPRWRRLDFAGLVYLSLCLASLELCLKESPNRGWNDGLTFALIALFTISGAISIRRGLTHPEPILDLIPFANPVFAAASLYSFVLGAGLYGSVYLLPLFLGIVRQHTSLEIGEIMIVGGGAQLVVAPIAAFAEVRLAPRLLTTIGYLLFGCGLLANGFATVETDFAGLLWPQLLRGAGVMLCLLPTTRVALDGRRDDALTDASALFNLMRNLGGAIGIALVDTIVERRLPVHAAALVERLQAGDPSAARFLGLPLDQFHNAPLGPVDDATRELVAPLVERGAFALSLNEAWLMLGAVFALSLLALPLLPRPTSR
jgi:MFS transporter, DHA2 family, multidrug resistance protein